MTIPAQYAWLNTLGTLPRMLTQGIALLGTVETPGGANNQRILDWAKEVDLQKVYTADSIPWCGLFMAVCAKRAGKEWPSTPLWALSWSKFGVPAGQPRLGDVLTFVRNGGGHVAFYIGEDADCYHVLGGNQSDAVTITRIKKARLHRVRRPVMNKPPASVQPFVLAATGAVSSNEA